MKIGKYILIICVIVSGALLASCHKKTNTAKKDAEEFIQRIKAASEMSLANKKKEAGSNVRRYYYEGAHMRDPFELPATVKNVKQYPNAILRDVGLDSLRFTGVIIHNDHHWAIFQTSKGQLYKLTEGMRVGVQQALLIDITQEQVKFVVDANAAIGEKQHEVVMTIQEPSS